MATRKQRDELIKLVNYCGGSYIGTDGIGYQTQVFANAGNIDRIVTKVSGKVNVGRAEYARAIEHFKSKAQVMTKNEFQQVAAVISEGMSHTSQAAKDAVTFVAEGICNILAKDNPKFDRDKFLKACDIMPK